MEARRPTSGEKFGQSVRSYLRCCLGGMAADPCAYSAVAPRPRG